MIVIDSMMNRSIRFVSVMNAGAARLRFRFPLVAITIGSRDGPCGFTIVIRCCNVVRASRQMSRVAMKAYSRPLYIYTRIYIFLSRIGDDHTRYEIFPSSFRLGEKSQHRVRYDVVSFAELERSLGARSASIFTFHNLPRDIRCGKRLGEGWRNPRDAIAMNMESGEQRERRFYECSVGHGSKPGPRSRDTTAIFAMLIISRDFIMDDVATTLVVESIEKPPPLPSRSPLVFRV